MGLKRQRYICAILGAVLLVILAGSPGLAAEVKSINIEQAQSRGAEITTYLNISDIQNAAVANVAAGDIKARLGQDDVPVKSLQPFSESGQGIAWVVLVDVSRSLNPEQNAQIKSAVKQLIDAMKSDDRMALMSFGTDVKIVADYSSDKNQLKGAVEGLQATDDNTQMYYGLLQAIDVSQRKDSGLPSRRLIILVSDGSEDYTGGVSKEEVLSKLKVNPIPVYSLGVYNASVNSDAGLEAMGEIARTSGGMAWQYDSSALGTGISILVQTTGSTYTAVLDSSKCPQDGRDYPLSVTYSSNGVAVEDSISMTLAVPVADSSAEGKESDARNGNKNGEKQDTWKQITSVRGINDIKALPVWVLASAGGLVLILLCLIIILIVRKRKKSGTNGIEYNAWVPYGEEGATRDYENAQEYGGARDLDFAGTVPDWSGAVPGPNGAYGAGDDGIKPYIPVQSPVIETIEGTAIPTVELHGSRNPVQQDAVLISLNTMGMGGEARTFALELSSARPCATVGRKGGNDLVIGDDDRISSVHCQFVLERGKIYIQDLESTNGTMVNGVPIIGKYALNDNDLILIGKTELRFAAKKNDGGPK